MMTLKTVSSSRRLSAEY